MHGARSAGTFRTALHGIAVPVPFSLEQFCRSVAVRRGRQVRVIGIPGLGPGCPGVWVSARQADIVCYPAGVLGLRRDEIVVHHLCHMLLGHRPRPVAGLAALIAPGVGQQLIGLMLGGDEAPAADARYADEAEQEQAADAMSSAILARADRSRDGPGCPPGRHAAAADTDAARR
jgi:hypothetical protein